jgi:hypothetical protein
MTTTSHRQYNPLYVLNRSALFVDEAVRTPALWAAAWPWGCRLPPARALPDPAKQQP